MDHPGGPDDGPRKYVLRCIKCDCRLEGEYIDCPDEGVSLRATGNYGSAVWDPIDDDVMFTAWLCDPCVSRLARSNHFVYEKVERQPMKRTRISGRDAGAHDM